MPVSQEDIVKMGKTIQEYQLSLASLEGQQKQILEVLKKEYGVDSLDDARKELELLKSESTELKEKLEDLFRKAQAILNRGKDDAILF